MNTFEITKSVLDAYKNDKLDETRITLLITQAKEQLKEISQNTAFYDNIITQVNAPKKIDPLILWILFMSSEEICSDYIDNFDKDFMDIIPISDLSDLVIYSVYLKKVKNINLDGFDYLSEYKSDGLDEVDQFSFTNLFLYIQKSKEVAIEF
jgi:hypothetical protein